MAQGDPVCEGSNMHTRDPGWRRGSVVSEERRVEVTGVCLTKVSEMIYRMGITGVLATTK